MKTFALIISGPVTSGKTTIAEELSKNLGIEVINEERVGNYYKILDHVDPHRYPRVIYDHCWFYKKWYLVRALYEKTLLVILNPSDELLEGNYNKRKETVKSGDYLKVDPIAQREEIMGAVEWLKKEASENHRFLVVDIKNREGYKDCIEEIMLKLK